MNSLVTVILAGLTALIVLGLVVTGLGLGTVGVEFGNSASVLQNGLTVISGDNTGMRGVKNQESDFSELSGFAVDVSQE